MWFFLLLFKIHDTLDIRQAQTFSVNPDPSEILRAV